jgi:hypothetical protein
MAKIRIHVLNFHGVFSHIELVLQDISRPEHLYYGINRWETPKLYWCKKGPKRYIEWASTDYSFDIEADPNEIIARWHKYWYQNQAEASVLGDNCAVAAMWFLQEFAGIPQPSLSNLSWNHLALGIIWPSFIPCPVTLPGRVLSNTKFHIEARQNPQISKSYSRLFLSTCVVFASITFAISLFELIVATGILLQLASVAACILSSHGFFKAYNALSAKNIADGIKPPQALIESTLNFSPI